MVLYTAQDVSCHIKQFRPLGLGEVWVGGSKLGVGIG